MMTMRMRMRRNDDGVDGRGLGGWVMGDRGWGIVGSSIQHCAVVRRWRQIKKVIGVAVEFAARIWSRVAAASEHEFLGQSANSASKRRRSNRTIGIKEPASLRLSTCARDPSPHPFPR
jgi:hypothetical protein